jgi:hypothetical protein
MSNQNPIVNEIMNGIAKQYPTKDTNKRHFLMASFFQGLNGDSTLNLYFEKGIDHKAIISAWFIGKNHNEKGHNKQPKPAQLRVSKIESPVKVCWDLFFALKAANPNLSRKYAVDSAIKLGVAVNTAKSQYQYWYTHYKGSSHANEVKSVPIPVVQRPIIELIK